MATRMQQRRGTAAQWISTNNGNGPILAPGEIGFEIDTNKFKIGDGINHWVNLTYFTDAESVLSAINNLVDGAPDLLNTLNEIASALGDDPNFFATVSTNLANHESDTTNVHGIEDTNELATKTYVADAIGNATVDQSALAGVGIDWNIVTEQFDIDQTVATKSHVDGLIGDLSVDGSAGNTIKDRIDTAVANLVDGAPALLDTLNELAAAIGDDENFITTIASDLATKQDKITGVSDTEIGYLANVTSDIQQQLDDKLASADLAEAAQDAVNDAIIAGTGLDKTYDDVSNTITINVDSTIATKVYADDSANLAENNAKNYAENYTNTAISNLDGNVTTVVNGNLDVLTGTGITTANGSVEVDFQELDTHYDSLGSADAAETAANLYTDTTITNLDLPGTYDALGAAATVAGNLTAHESDTSTHGVSSSIVGTDDVQTLTNKIISYTDNTITVQVANVSDLTATASELNTLDGITASTVELNYVDGVTSSIQDQLDSKIPTSGGTFTGTVYGTNLELSGNLTVEGNFSSVPTETLAVTNPMIYMGENNPANINDLGFVASHTIDSVYSHTGLVKDATDGKWKLFTDVTDEPTTTVNFAQGSLDTLAVATLEGNVVGDVTGNADTATALETARTIAGQSFDGTANIEIAPTDLTGVTATAAEINILDGATLSTTELNYVDGVTSAIQDQIDTKLDSSTAASTYAPIASPTFTGTVSGITSSMVGLGNVDNTSDVNKPVSTATQNALDLKANLNAPIFTGSVVLPETTAIGNVSATEIGYLDGVTSGIQTQLDDKAPLASPSLTGVPTAPTASAGTNTTQIATTAFVQTAVDNLIDGAPGALDTLNELAAALNDDASYATTITNALATKQDKVTGVSDTEIGYLDGVTSSIQTQLDSKASSVDVQNIINAQINPLFWVA